MYFLIILAGILIMLSITISIQFFNIIFRGFAPFISSKPKVIKKILDEIDFNNHKIKVYELGCGNAGFLRALEDKRPDWKFIGIENSFLPWFIAKIQTSLNHSKIKILKKNLFKVNLSETDLLYCYLNIEMMKKLENKFKEECKPGTIIISNTFTMPNLHLEKTVKLENGDKVYFYKIQ